VTLGARLTLVLLALLVVCGGALRLLDLDRQIFWDDEVWTGLRVAGASDTRIDEFFDGRTLTAAQTRAILRGRAASPQAIVTSLARFEPQWPPLYILLTWMWTGAFGTAPAALRCLAALFGIAAIPAVYWLGLEVFRERSAALFAATLVAFSPAEVAYAREARGYSLLLVLTALATACLLRALRTRRRAWWGGFALCSLLGLYSYSLYVAVAVGHLAVALARERSFRARGARMALVASGVALGLFLPWLCVLVVGRYTVAGTLPRTGVHFSPLFVFGKGLLNIAQTFFAATYYDLSFAPLSVAVAAIVLALCAIYARSDPRGALVLASFSLPCLLATGAWDLARGQHTILIYRYGTTTWLALQLGVAGGVAWLVRYGAPLRRRAAAVAGAALVVLCLVSSITTISAKTFWDSWYNADATAFARIVNALPQPLIVVDHDSDNIFTFVDDLRPDVRIHFVRLHEHAVSAAQLRAASHIVILTATPQRPRDWHGPPLRQAFTFDMDASLVVRLRKRFHNHALAYGTDPFVGSDTIWIANTR
jgi:uncharacterized membrane protein